ncbi:deoxyribonuclease-1 [Aplysia californica]|uniref:Deoxyribonuclease n=1 Tax=Aplysia californica TaxID=6500 RepID=A0ABM0JBJ0_APLCA|nr:deoxyribonuclease-1 [Aplysia californica]
MAHSALIVPLASILMISGLQGFLVDDQDVIDNLRVGSFNVKWFDVAKSANQDVMRILSQIIQRYDVMLMIEIRDDHQQTAMNRLWTLVNQTAPFGLSLSGFLGRYPDFYTEQYGFFYRLSSVSLEGTYQYNDSLHNEFEREPYSASFRRLAPGSVGLPFIASHIQPKNARVEMAHMTEVVDAVKAHFSSANVVVMGDLNADCSYMSASDLATTPLRNSTVFTWLIPDSADTTMSTYTDCAYDRIIVTKGLRYSNAGVFYFDQAYNLTYNQASAVSDHYPVETVFLGQ